MRRIVSVTFLILALTCLGPAGLLAQGKAPVKPGELIQLSDDPAPAQPAKPAKTPLNPGKTAKGKVAAKDQAQESGPDSLPEAKAQESVAPASTPAAAQAAAPAVAAPAAPAEAPAPAQAAAPAPAKEQAQARQTQAPSGQEAKSPMSPPAPELKNNLNVPMTGDPGPSKEAVERFDGGETQPVQPVNLGSAGSNDILLCALAPLTGKNAANGAAMKAALEQAATDLNAYFGQVESPKKAVLHIEDTGSAPRQALGLLKGYQQKGVTTVIGPYSDDEAYACREWATKHNIVLISPGSTGPHLSIKDDNLFRLAPSDTHQAEAVATLAWQEGVTTLVPLWRGDEYGDDLVVHVKGHFRNLGGTAQPGVRFRPGVTEFASYLNDLKAQIDAAAAQSGKKGGGKVGVYLACGDESVKIFNQAQMAGLSGLRWFGCDATAFNEALAADPGAAEFAIKTGFWSPAYGESGSHAYGEVENKIAAKTKGFIPPKAMTAYDAAWLVAFCNLAGPMKSASTAKKLIQDTAPHIYGATGWLTLNEYGDRFEDWNFDFWAIKREGGKMFWEKAARFQYEPGATKQLFVNRPE